MSYVTEFRGGNYVSYWKAMERSRKWVMDPLHWHSTSPSLSLSLSLSPPPPRPRPLPRLVPITNKMIERPCGRLANDRIEMSWINLARGERGTKERRTPQFRLSKLWKMPRITVYWDRSTVGFWFHFWFWATEDPRKMANENLKNEDKRC